MSTAQNYHKKMSRKMSQKMSQQVSQSKLKLWIIRKSRVDAEGDAGDMDDSWDWLVRAHMSMKTSHRIHILGFYRYIHQKKRLNTNRKIRSPRRRVRPVSVRAQHSAALAPPASTTTSGSFTESTNDQRKVEAKKKAINRLSKTSI